MQQPRHLRLCDGSVCVPPELQQQRWRWRVRYPRRLRLLQRIHQHLLPGVQRARHVLERAVVCVHVQSWLRRPGLPAA